MNSQMVRHTKMIRDKFEEGVKALSFDLTPPEMGGRIEKYLSDCTIRAINDSSYSTQNIMKKKFIEAITATDFFITPNKKTKKKEEE